MKILIVAHEYYPHGSGIANLVYYLKNEFERKNNKVKICSPIGPNIKVGSKKLIDKLGGLGIIYFWLKAGKIIKEQKNKYDVIWLHNPLVLTKIKTDKSYKTQKSDNIFATTHTLYKEVYKNYIKKTSGIFTRAYYSIISFIEKLSYLYFMKKFRFNVTSTKTIQELRGYNIKGDFLIIHNGAKIIKNKNEKQIRKQLYKKLKIDNSKKTFFFIGRLNKQKNLFRMADTFNRINKALGNKYVLVLMGDGELRNEFEEYIKVKGIGNVYLMGRVPHKELMKLYSAGDFFFSASHYEGYPLTLAEGLCEGLIPILSEISIFKEMVGKTQSGINVNFNNPANAAKKISNYIKKVNITNEKKKIKKIIQKEYNYSEIANKYLSYFNYEIKNKMKNKKN